MDNRAEKLVSSMEEKLRKYSQDRSYGTVCIYGIPEKYRIKNERAYSPRLVSIGFIHHGKLHLQAIEKYKLKYLSHFLYTFRISLKDLAEYILDKQKSVSDCYEGSKEPNLNQKSVCDCYKDSEEPNLNPGEVILLDSIFILDLFLKNHFVGVREKVDVVFDNPSVSNDILHDLLLLENQMPFTFLSELYDKFVLNRVSITLDEGATYNPSFNKLVHKYFKDVGSTQKLLLTSNFNHVRHFVEFLSILHKPTDAPKKQSDVKSDFAKCPSAKELKVAGVKFKGDISKSLLNVEFRLSNGELNIPTLTVSDSTETFFHNLIAFERSEYKFKHITSSAILLGNLIKTPEDVDILIQKHVIINEFGSSDKVASLFSNLYEDLVIAREDFQFVEVCDLLNHYRRDCFRHLKAKYADTPLLQAAGLAALLTIVLTLVSTVCSILQVLGVGSLK